MRRALSREILHHRGREFKALFDELRASLQRLFRASGEILLMTGSGTAAMESSVVNLLSAGDEALVCSTGLFGERFAEILAAYGARPILLRRPLGESADSGEIVRSLREHPGVKAVFLQHSETSTGVLNDVAELSRAVRENSDALVVVDAISSLGVERLEMDAWGLDAVVSASQKGLMNAPGLSFAALSNRALKRLDEARLPRFYLDWRTMRHDAPLGQTPYTPAVPLFAGQLEALRLIEREGLENVWARAVKLSQFALERARALGFSPYARHPTHGLSALLPPEGEDAGRLVEALREDGIWIAHGQKQLKGKILRVAHMGYIRKAAVARAFAAIEARLARPPQPVRA